MTTKIDEFIRGAAEARASGNHSDALDIARRIMVLFPESPEGYPIASECYQVNGKLIEAAGVCETGLRHVPLSLEIWRAYGDLLMKSHKFGEALALWQKAISKFPQYGYAYNRAAWTAM